jgi:hypothetical protein
MSTALKKEIPDPKEGVASSAVATSLGQPGGHVLSEDDIPALLAEGIPRDEIEALQLASPERLEEIVNELAQKARPSVEAVGVAGSR